MRFSQVLVLISFFFLSCVQASPPITSYEDMEGLINRGIVHQGFHYSIPKFPRLVSTSMLPGTFRDFEGLCVEPYSSFISAPSGADYGETTEFDTPLMQFSFDGYVHAQHQGEDRTQGPRSRYLNLVKGAKFKSGGFRNITCNPVFAIQVEPPKESNLPVHFLILRKMKRNHAFANATEVEMAIRLGKLEGRSSLIGNIHTRRATFGSLIQLFREQGFTYMRGSSSHSIPDQRHTDLPGLANIINSYLSGNFTSSQEVFIYRSLGLIPSGLDRDAARCFNYDINEFNDQLVSCEVVPFKDYLASLNQNEKKIYFGWTRTIEQ